MDSDTKICSKCKLPLPIGNFALRSDRRSGRVSSCKACQRVRTIKYRAEHREQCVARCKAWHAAHVAHNKRYRKKIKPHYDAWRASNKIKIRKTGSEYYQKYKDKIKLYVSAWTRCNGLKRRAASARYMRKIRSTPLGRLVSNLRSRVRSAIKGVDKSDRTMQLIGCTPGQLRVHLEQHFSFGMTWFNYGCGGWSVDHIRPCASYDLSDPAAQRACFNWRNLQPLWESANASKRDKWGNTDVASFSSRELAVPH